MLHSSGIALLIVVETKSMEDRMVAAKTMRASLAATARAPVSANSPLPRTIRLTQVVR